MTLVAAQLWAAASKSRPPLRQYLPHPVSELSLQSWSPSHSIALSAQRARAHFIVLFNSIRSASELSRIARSARSSCQPSKTSSAVRSSPGRLVKPTCRSASVMVALTARVAAVSFALMLGSAVVDCRPARQLLQSTAGPLLAPGYFGTTNSSGTFTCESVCASSADQATNSRPMHDTYFQVPALNLANSVCAVSTGASYVSGWMSRGGPPACSVVVNGTAASVTSEPTAADGAGSTCVTNENGVASTTTDFSIAQIRATVTPTFETVVHLGSL
ncbi:hypothetical protein WJX84_001317 [Apatococcus fuscideae]|uniref:Uncharacterized protein n=1 Tax=Apatococcus fuscideae TaxID=2026836 RepID=A0AAW1RIJ2_9CHLO